jgi:hypothetical protein
MKSDFIVYNIYTYITLNTSIFMRNLAVYSYKILNRCVLKICTYKLDDSALLFISGRTALLLRWDFRPTYYINKQRKLTYKIYTHGIMTNNVLSERRPRDFEIYIHRNIIYVRKDMKEYNIRYK